MPISRSIPAAIGLSIAVLLGACTTRPYPSAPEVGDAESSVTNTSRIRTFVRPGDQLEVRYYRNTQLNPNRYVVGVYDELSVTVVEHPTLSRPDVNVLPDGRITLPLVGSVIANGKTVDELGRELRGLYGQRGIRTPQVIVAVNLADQRLENLLGAGQFVGGPFINIVVSNSGFVDLPYIESISTDQPLVDLQRTISAAYAQEFGGRLEVVTNLTTRATPLVYVIGEVNAPAGVELQRAFNPFMAIAAAGGYLPSAATYDVRVVRYLDDGSFKHWKFDLQSSLGDASGFRLQPDDVIVVPPSGVIVANRWIQQYIRDMLPVRTTAGFGLSYILNPSNGNNN